MDATNNRITFFKNKIKDRLEELRPYMSDIKYRLYQTMIEQCSSLEEIREMAELDMHCEYKISVKSIYTSFFFVINLLF